MFILWEESLIKKYLKCSDLMERVIVMFSGAVSVKILSENQIIAVRSKARWLAEKIGFDKIHAGVLSAIISQTARLLLSQTNSGRIDVLSIRHNKKTGVTVIAFLDELNRNEIEKKARQKMNVINRTNFLRLTSRHLIDEYKIFPGENRAMIMQLTKWV
jgi:hypothetical protein